MRNVFEAYDRAVEFAQSTTLPRDQIPEIVAYGFVHYGVPFMSACELAKEIVETWVEKVADPYPTLTEDEQPCIDF